jgi:hypothetical protein
VKKTRSVSVVSFVVTLLVVVFSAPGWAQTTSPLAPGGVKVFTQINPPPCDFSDLFYQENGIDPTQLVARFGSARQTGAPATGTQVNWVADSTCSTDDPTRRNFRILATTGGFVDDGTGAATDFISILAFLVNQTNFETSFSHAVGGSTISITNSLNPRGIAMQDIVGHFEAYAAVKQRLADGTFALNPCAADMASPDAPATPCFKVDTVNTIFTPNLRQDWRFATNRNAMDGSDGNCINTDTGVCSSISDSPFGYFCDDQLGMWIITYFWFTVDPANPNPNPTQQCGSILAALGQKNGFNLDGTPIIKTADELNNQLEANHCGAEGQEAVDGTDGGAIWLICPAIMDPRNGGIAKDAFLDVVRLANGNAQSTALLNNFSCLQNTGKFCNEAAPEN